MRKMFKLLAAVSVAAAVIASRPCAVKANAISQSADFAKIQENWLNATNDYYTTYQDPVMQNYAAAINSQTAQALAAKYYSDLMAQQADARRQANLYQMSTDYYAYQQNLATQYQNLINTTAYNYEVAAMNNYYQSVQNMNNFVGNLYGVSVFPQNY